MVKLTKGTGVNVWDLVLQKLTNNDVWVRANRRAKKHEQVMCGRGYRCRTSGFSENVGGESGKMENRGGRPNVLECSRTFDCRNRTVT